MRYEAAEKTLGGIVRFGDDCEGPPGCAHGVTDPRNPRHADSVEGGRNIVFGVSVQKTGLTLRLRIMRKNSVPFRMKSTTTVPDMVFSRLRRTGARARWEHRHRGGRGHGYGDVPLRGALRPHDQARVQLPRSVTESACGAEFVRPRVDACTSSNSKANCMNSNCSQYVMM